jgi:hypothetical protein
MSCLIPSVGTTQLIAPMTYSHTYNHDAASEACDLSIQYTCVGVTAVSGPFVFVFVSSL